MLLLILFIQILLPQEQILFHKYSSIEDTHIINENIIYARPFGQNYILYTENGGKDWEVFNLGIINSLIDSKYDGQYIWAVNNGGILLKINPLTKEVEGIDIGYNYTPNNGRHSNFISISNDIIAVTHFNNKLSISTNYGKTWELKEIPKFEGYEAYYIKPFLLDNELYIDYYIRYSNKENGNLIIDSDGKQYLQTKNLETNKDEWKEISDSELNEIRNKKPTKVFNKEVVFQSKDLGKTWEKYLEFEKNKEDKSYQLVQGMKKNNKGIWIFGLSGLLIKTSDKGKSWEWFDAKTEKGIDEIILKDNKLILACGYNGALVLEYDYKNVKKLYEDESGAVNDIDLYGDYLYVSGGENGTIHKILYK